VARLIDERSEKGFVMEIGDIVKMTNDAILDNYGEKWRNVLFKVIYVDHNVGGVGHEYTMYDLEPLNGGDFHNALYGYELIFVRSG
jgi:hypothetical protein